MGVPPNNASVTNPLPTPYQPPTNNPSNPYDGRINYPNQGYSNPLHTTLVTFTMVIPPVLVSVT